MPGILPIRSRAAPRRSRGRVPERGEECKRGIANDLIVAIGRAGHRANPTIDILVFAG